VFCLQSEYTLSISGKYRWKRSSTCYVIVINVYDTFTNLYAVGHRLSTFTFTTLYAVGHRSSDSEFEQCLLRWEEIAKASRGSIVARRSLPLSPVLGFDSAAVKPSLLPVAFYFWGAVTKADQGCAGGLRKKNFIAGNLPCLQRYLTIVASAACFGIRLCCCRTIVAASAFSILGAIAKRIPKASPEPSRNFDLRLA